MNPQAEELNIKIKEYNPNVYSMLSNKGKEIFFPKKGILAQTADAKGKAKEFEAIVRIDTQIELSYYKNRGILHTMLREMEIK